MPPRMTKRSLDPGSCAAGSMKYEVKPFEFSLETTVCESYAGSGWGVGSMNNNPPEKSERTMADSIASLYVLKIDAPTAGPTMKAIPTAIPTIPISEARSDSDPDPEADCSLLYSLKRAFRTV